jgi:hypothetical protein
MQPPTYVVGDVHGYLDTLVALLRAERLLNPGMEWAGDNATLVFMGDYVDIGPDGVGVIDLVMRLQKQAASAGGEVLAILGNHDVAILSAYYASRQLFPASPWGTDFYPDWLCFGRQSDLERLTAAHISWLSVLPAMLLVDDRRFIHADSLVYFDYGKTAPEVNKAFRTLLRNRDPEAWSKLLNRFAERGAFADANPVGKENALHFLSQYNGHGIVHGHTAITRMTGQRYEDVTAPLVYAGGLCTNVDGGIHRGGPGFVYRLPSLTDRE